MTTNKTQLEVKLSDELHSQLQRAARLQGCTFDEYVISTLNKAVQTTYTQKKGSTRTFSLRRKIVLILSFFRKHSFIEMPNPANKMELIVENSMGKDKARSRVGAAASLEVEQNKTPN